jgi:hypothetical protein
MLCWFILKALTTNNMSIITSRYKNGLCVGEVISYYVMVIIMRKIKNHKNKFSSLGTEVGK